MPRLLPAALLLILAIPAAGQEGDDEAASHETVVVTDTGGERAGAARPDLGKVESAVVARTNEFRKAKGHGHVTVDETLTDAARRFAEYMAKTGRYGHRADGNGADERVRAAGYEFCSVRENIAYAFRSDGFETDALAGQFFDGWKESPGHRANMLAEYAVETGVAVVKSGETDTYFAVQLFARPKSMAVEFEVANRSSLTVTYRVGERDFPLAPRVIRTHSACRPQPVTFLAAISDADQTDPPAVVERVEVSGGERLTVEAAEESYRVAVDREPGSDP